MNPNIDEPERRLIRDAMTRLLDGDPIRSDGKLTVKSLAAEAGLKCWYLTHKHTDLRDEFYDRVHVQGTTPAAMTKLYEEIAALKEAHKQNRAALRDAVAQKNIYARETQVLEVPPVWRTVLVGVHATSCCMSGNVWGAMRERVVGIRRYEAGALAMSTPTNTLTSYLPTGGVLASDTWVLCSNESSFPSFI